MPFAPEEDDTEVADARGRRTGIAALVRRNIAGKWEGHEINSTRCAPPRPMYSIMADFNNPRKLDLSIAKTLLSHDREGLGDCGRLLPNSRARVGLC